METTKVITRVILAEAVIRRVTEDKDYDTPDTHLCYHTSITLQNPIRAGPGASSANAGSLLPKFASPSVLDR
jgi:hypothetical protein